MIGDSDIQVWLDSQPNAGQLIMVPYLKSAREMQVSYRLTVIQSGKSGNSTISQGGTVRTSAASATPLSRVVIAPNKEGECRIEVTLREGEQALGNYRFDCPRASPS